ncbi:MAG TPA: UvrB/UvrC motif-containing protein [Calditerricola sp.]|uniref:UVR domain-containing protein n=1 Tax=Calditerricola satsumensis TaxID=373054 RepID=A0A8J3FCB2_9BACI|nr:UvrB/UvrC motif-containing protein [Calditerricola satsumensis]GGK05389.1 hypothetical protein GCM10007043_19230 [Calditerricola satsumensis]
MMCQECGQRPATLHFTKIVNGDKTEFHLCERCAREKGELIPGMSNTFSIHNLLSGLMNFDVPTHTGHPAQALRCNVCGLTYTQFSKTGRFGCPACYEAFDAHLEPLFRRLHGATAHTGKVPARAGGVMRLARELERLKAELKQAVAREEFERAAQLRDRIRQLEAQIDHA